VFCVSRELSARAAGDDKECVEIIDVPAFFQELNLGMTLAHPQQGNEAELQLSAVTYSERALPHEFYGYISPACLKEPRFSVEVEVRAVWRTLRPEGKAYHDFSRPALRALVHKVEIPTD
jgi:hypothetical protein